MTSRKDIKDTKKGNRSRSPSEESDQASTDGDDEVSYSLDKLENLVLSFLAEFLHFQKYDINDAIHAEIPFIFNLKRKLQLMNHLLRRFEPKFQKYFVIQIMDDLHELTKKRNSTNNAYLKPFHKIKEIVQLFAEKIQSHGYSIKTPEVRAKNLAKLIVDLKSSPYNEQKQKESGAKIGNGNMNIESPRVVPAVHYNNVMNQLFVKGEISPRSQAEQNSRKPTPVSGGHSSTNNLDFSTYPFPPYSTRALAAYAREKTKEPPDRTPSVPPPSPQYEQNSTGSTESVESLTDDRKEAKAPEITIDQDLKKQNEPCPGGDTFTVQSMKSNGTPSEGNQIHDSGGDFDSNVPISRASRPQSKQEKLEQKRISVEKPRDPKMANERQDSGSEPKSGPTVTVSSSTGDAYKSKQRYRNLRPKNSADEKLYGFLEQADMIKRTIRESRKHFFGIDDSNRVGVSKSSGTQDFDIRKLGQSSKVPEDKLPLFGGTKKPVSPNQVIEMAQKISFPIQQVLADLNIQPRSKLAPESQVMSKNQNSQTTGNPSHQETYTPISTVFPPENPSNQYRPLNFQFDQNQKSKQYNMEKHVPNSDLNEDDNTRMVQIPYRELLKLEAEVLSARRARKRDESNSNDSTIGHSFETQNQYMDGAQKLNTQADLKPKKFYLPSIDFRGIEKAREKLISFRIENEQPELSNTFYSNGETRQTDTRLTTEGRNQIRAAILTNDRRNLLTDKTSVVQNKQSEAKVSTTHKENTQRTGDVPIDSPMESFYKIVTPTNSGRREIKQQNIVPEIPVSEKTPRNMDFVQNDGSQTYSNVKSNNRAENTKPEDRFNNFVKNEKHNLSTPDYQNYARQFALLRHLLPAYKRKDPAELPNTVIENKITGTSVPDPRQKSVQVQSNNSEVQHSHANTNVQVYKYTVKQTIKQNIENGRGIPPGNGNQVGQSDPTAANFQNSVERKSRNEKTNVNNLMPEESFQNKVKTSTGVGTSQLKHNPNGTDPQISDDRTKNTMELAQRLRRVIQTTLDRAALDVKQETAKQDIKQDVSKLEGLKEKQFLPENWEFIRNEAFLKKQALDKKVKPKNTETSSKLDKSKPPLIRTTLGEARSIVLSKSGRKRNKRRKSPALRIASSNSSKTSLHSMRSYSTRNVADDARTNRRKSFNRTLSNIEISGDGSLPKQIFPKAIETYDWPLGKPLAERYYNNTNIVFSSKYKTGAGRVNYPNGKPCILTSGSKPQFQLLIFKAHDKIERYKMKVIAAFDTSGEGIVYDSNGKLLLEYDGVGGSRFDQTSGTYVKWNWSGSGNLRLRLVLNPFLTIRLTDLRRIQLLFNANIRNMRLSIGKGSRSQQFMRGVQSMENQTRCAGDDDCVQKFIHSLSENERYQ